MRTCSAAVNNCKFCSSYNHNSVNCGVYENDNRKKSLLTLTINPILSFIVSRGIRKAKLVFLMDSGSQLSVIYKDVVEKYIGKFRCLLSNIMLVEVGG